MRKARTATALMSAGGFAITTAGAAGTGSASPTSPHSAHVRPAGISFGRAAEIRLPANASAKQLAFLATVDCQRGGECVAGGGYESRAGSGIREQPMIVTESRGRWARARELALPSPKQGYLASIDCTGPGSCMAAGDYIVPAGNSAGFVVTESRGRWGPVRRLFPPRNATIGARFSVNALFCPQAGSCAAVGWYHDSRGAETWVATETRGKWQAAREIRPPATSPASNRFADPSSIACPRAGACVAVGSYQDVSGTLRAFAVSQSGGGWRPAVQVRPPGNAARFPDANLASVSCPSGGACVAAGDYAATAPPQQAMIATESGGRWHQARALTLLPPNASATATSSLQAIACPSVRSCVAVGIYDAAAGGIPAMYLTESAGIWRKASELAMPPNAATPFAVELDAEDCSASGFCAVVGSYFTTGVNSEAAMAALS